MVVRNGKEVHRVLDEFLVLLQIDTLDPQGRCLASAILEIAAGGALGTLCLKKFTSPESALEAQTFGAQGRRKLKPPVFFLFVLCPRGSAPRALSLSPPC